MFSIAGKELLIFWAIRANRDTFLDFFMLIVDIVRVTKKTGYKLVVTPGGLGRPPKFGPNWAQMNITKWEQLAQISPNLSQVL